ncbi:Wzz/FepE/Etk N-terminal domain-containing protein [Vibrio rotiferianus]|uniref:Wzz/FepE/Etk N-terminal domain-containing protein n=1 Tax=Vibrio rotiferianus TaxID=190895 RepID=UPI00406A9B74
MEPHKEPSSNYLSYPPQSADNEIDLRELFKALWKGKWIIIVTTFVFAVGAVLYALSLPNIYKSDALLAPAESSSGGGLSKMAGQLGGLAALAGVNLGAGESSQTDLAVQVMKSRQFIGEFIKKHDLLVPLMATKGWDLTNDRLIYNEKVYNSKTGQWLRKPNGVFSSQPTKQEAYDVFSEKVFNIIEDKESGLYTITVKHYSPNVARQWVSWLVEDINEVMRKRSIADASRNLRYLNSQLTKTSIADMQNTFYKLIEEQTKSLMLAEVQEEFVFKTIDPAITPEQKFEPKRAVICILITFLGLALSMIFVLMKFAFKK